METLIIVLGIGIAVVFLGLIAVGQYLVTRDTARRRGRWGINTEPLYCRKCDTPSPGFRIPKSLNQTLWGGWTCAECGYELDKWGEPIENQPFPAKWSALLDDPPETHDTRFKTSINDIQRGDYHE